jgi:hypothetical protein
MLYEPFWRYGGKYPIEISAEQKLFKEAAEWLKTRNIEDRTLYFLYPYHLVVLLGLMIYTLHQ